MITYRSRPVLSFILLLLLTVIAARQTFAQEASVVEPTTNAVEVSVTSPDNSDSLSWRPPFDVRSGGMCFFLLLMGGAGVAAFFLKQTLPGILFLAGVLLLAVDPLLDLVVYRLMTSSESLDSVGWVYALASLITSIIAYALISAAFLIAAKRARSAAP